MLIERRRKECEYLLHGPRRRRRLLSISKLFLKAFTTRLSNMYASLTK
jgi:hypothetical protein